MLPHPPLLLSPLVACLPLRKCFGKNMNLPDPVSRSPPPQMPLRKCFGKNMKLSYGIMLGLCLNSAWTLLLAGLVLNTSGTVVSGGAGAQYVWHGGEWRGWCSIRQARW